jgi:hypothetical protein
MIRGLSRFAAFSAALAASAVLIGSVAQAGEIVNEGGEPGAPGTAISNCRPDDDRASQMVCVVSAEPGAPGEAVEY